MANGVYEEPGWAAHQQRGRWDGDFTLTTTALVHEAYLELAGQRRLPTESRSHFLAIASKAMRPIRSRPPRRARARSHGDRPVETAGERNPADPVPRDHRDPAAVR